MNIVNGFKKDKKTGKSYVQIHLNADETFGLEFFSKESKITPQLCASEILQAALKDMAEMRMREIKKEQDGHPNVKA